MIFIYGWLKEKRLVKPVLSCYCYVCQRTESWGVLRETEWVTFFGMRTIPFLSKDALACTRCGDHTPLERAHSTRLQRGEQLDQTEAFVEQFQLARKSEVQRNFLLATRAGREQDR